MFTTFHSVRATSCRTILYWQIGVEGLWEVASNLQYSSMA